MENPVGLEYLLGFRFRPTDVEFVDFYLRQKNSDSDTSFVDRFISTVTIRDPWELPGESRIKLKDHVWCFFCRMEKRYRRGERRVRKTKSGYWKITGNPKDIMRTSDREKIGERRVLMFYYSKELGGSKSDWVMHEYQLFCPNQTTMTYTSCKLMFKGEASELEQGRSLIPHLVNSSGGSSGSSFHSPEFQNSSQFSGSVDVQEEAQLGHAPTIHSDEEWKTYLVDDNVEQMNTMLMQDNRNDHRPPKPLTGVFIDHTSDDDDDSDLLTPEPNSIQTLSTCDSFGSSSHRIDQSKYLQESPNSTIKLSLTQEVSQALRTSIDTTEITKMNPCDDARGTEIGKHKLGQETMKNKRAGFIHRMIQQFVKKIRLCSCTSKT